MMVYQRDSITLDASRITEETHPTFGLMTVFHDVVIASEIVQEYDDGRAFKNRDELESYAWSVDGAWIIAGGHPAEGIISDRGQVSGRTVNPRYVKNLKDPKTDRPSRAGVIADVQVFNDQITPVLLDEMKAGTKQDVSIGFFFSKDATPGVVEADSCKGEEYDYVQRDMFHNHLAVGIDNGRCTMPYCGLGADEMRKMIVGDPFAGHKNWGECVKTVMSENSDLSKEDAEAICGKLKSEHEDRIMEDDLVKYASKILNQVMGLHDEIQALKGERDALKESQTTEWWKQINWDEEKFPTIFEHLNEETRQLITTEGLCPTCGKDAPRSEAERAMSHFNLSEEEWNKLSDEEKQEYINKLPERGSGDSDEECEEGYEKNEEGECVKKEEEKDMKESNPGFAPGKAEEECPEGMEWNAEKKQCVEIADFSDRPENKKVDALDPRKVLDRANAVL